MTPIHQRHQEKHVLLHIILPSSLMTRRELVSGSHQMPDLGLSLEQLPNQPDDGGRQLQLIHPHTPPSPYKWSCFSVDTTTSGGTATSLGLTGDVGSGATVRGVFWGMVERDVEGGISKLLGAVESAALRTQGQMVAVVSGLCNVGWNAGSSCYEYVARSAHFVSVLMPAAEVKTHIGVATGRVLSGNVCGLRMRYVTVA
eukprot:Hpha_TRINITY_DN16066_c3_g1::TRINITY_DN16066_c3_g1_i1::g.119879::m.119879